MQIPKTVPQLWHIYSEDSHKETKPVFIYTAAQQAANIRNATSNFKFNTRTFIETIHPFNCDSSEKHHIVILLR